MSATLLAGRVVDPQPFEVRYYTRCVTVIVETCNASVLCVICELIPGDIFITLTSSVVYFQWNLYVPPAIPSLDNFVLCKCSICTSRMGAASNPFISSSLFVLLSFTGVKPNAVLLLRLKARLSIALLVVREGRGRLRGTNMWVLFSSLFNP